MSVSSLRWDSTEFSTTLKLLQWVWELRRPQESKSVSVFHTNLLNAELHRCRVFLYISFSQKFNFSITEQPPHSSPCLGFSVEVKK